MKCVEKIIRCIGKNLKWIPILLMMSLVPAVSGLRNPSMVYCEELNYSFVTDWAEEGEIGVCQFPNGSSCEAWSFLMGKCGEEESHCVQEGYEIKTIADADKCSPIFSDECAVCVLENETETEVTKLMDLSFEETTCGDGSCGFPENYNTCPSDCLSGSYDGYCDGAEDGVCDQDCVDLGYPEDDADCPVCGDGKCEEDVGESYVNCPEDCTEPTMCGNDKCELTYDENYDTCREDCPSGSSDEYCDGMSDDICDPDCLAEDDPDCMKPPNLAWIFLIALAIVVVVVVFVLIKSRRGYAEEKSRRYPLMPLPDDE